MSSKNEAIKDARTLGVPKMLLLGLQHMFAMFGATILVPILVGGYFEGQGLSIQVTLFFAGVGTLFFHLCSKMKVPAFLGSSFAFLGGYATMASLDTGKYGSPVIWKGIGNWKADRFRWWDLDKTGCEIFGRRRCL